MNKLRLVLLVDDDDATNFINKLLIHKFDLTDELVIAKNGKEALDFLQKRMDKNDSNLNAFPELILLDINMPVMDGFGFLEAFDTLDLPQKSKIKIAVLTTSMNPKDIDKVKALGVSDFLNKPLSKATLQNLVHKHYA
jgi:CheY-like chemotaxis protein